MTINVPYLDQSKEAPTGCESVSSVMLLNYLGYQVSIGEFLDKYLDHEFFGEKNGELWGPDPHERFVGNPRDPEALGCYAPVIVNALRRTPSFHAERLFAPARRRRRIPGCR